MDKCAEGPREEANDIGLAALPSHEAGERLARLTQASQQAAEVADYADSASHLLALATERYPELGGVDTQMLGLLLGDLAGRLEELASLTARFSQHCENVKCPGVPGCAVAGREGGGSAETAERAKEE